MNDESESGNNITGKYILDEHGNPRPEPNLLKWGKWFEFSEDRFVKQEQVGRFWVSTVFLGIDHGWGRSGPILWETMIFGPTTANESRSDRCSGNREQAEAMHAKMVKLVKRHEGMWVYLTFVFISMRWIHWRIIERIKRRVKPYWCRMFHEEHWRLGSIGPIDRVTDRIMCHKCFILPFFGRMIEINKLNRIKRK